MSTPRRPRGTRRASSVAGVRVTAYVNRAAATELARLVPLGLLGVLIVEPGYLTASTAWANLQALPALGPAMLRYFLAFVGLELLLRLVRLALPGRDDGAARETTVSLVPGEPSARPLQARRP